MQPVLNSFLKPFFGFWSFIHPPPPTPYLNLTSTVHIVTVNVWGGEGLWKKITSACLLGSWGGGEGVRWGWGGGVGRGGAGFPGGSVDQMNLFTHHKEICCCNMEKKIFSDEEVFEQIKPKSRKAFEKCWKEFKGIVK
jgi:hypothetical protein